MHLRRLVVVCLALLLPVAATAADAAGGSSPGWASRPALRAGGQPYSSTTNPVSTWWREEVAQGFRRSMH